MLIDSLTINVQVLILLLNFFYRVLYFVKSKNQYNK